MSTYKKDEELLPFSYQPYQKSDSVKQAEALLKQHTANRPAAYQPQYKGEMDNLRSQIENRKPFQYDVNGDALYNQYKDRYIHNGQRAMMDTMGQAAALTGGYGSSYAQNVGQQAYNEYMTGLNDVIPELYQLALDRYDREGDALKDRYAMYADLDAQGYSQWLDGQSAYYSQLDRLTENARYEQEQDWSKYAAGYDAAYTQYEKAMKEAEERAAADQKIVDGANNNGSVSPGNIKTMQRMLGTIAGGYWGTADAEAAGNLTAEKAWTAYQQGKLQSRSKTGMTADEWAAYRQGIPKPTVGPNVKVTPEYSTVVGDLNTYIKNGASKSEIGTYLRSAYQSGYITADQYEDLRRQFTPAGNTY